MMQRLADPSLRKFKQIEHIIQGEHPDVWAALSFLHEYQEGWNLASRTDVLQDWLHVPKPNMASPEKPAPKQRSLLTREKTNVNQFDLLADAASAPADDDEWIDLKEDEPMNIEQEAEQGAQHTARH